MLSVACIYRSRFCERAHYSLSSATNGIGLASCLRMSSFIRRSTRSRIKMLSSWTWSGDRPMAESFNSRMYSLSSVVWITSSAQMSRPWVALQRMSESEICQRERERERENHVQQMHFEQHTPNIWPANVIHSKYCGVTSMSSISAVEVLVFHVAVVVCTR
jgi:hypothetical protein